MPTQSERATRRGLATIGRDGTAVGETMYRWARDLFPINRSLTGPGVRETLTYLQGLIPGLTVQSAPSGTRAFDWTVPDEWTIRDAYIADEGGNRVVDFRRSNLHVAAYSVPVDTWLTRAELESHLHSIPEKPDAIPYVTSYYARTWGFCLSHAEREKLPDGRYHVVIDSDLRPGKLEYGELIIPGREDKEVLLSTNICHPSLANNELSGIVVTAALARWVLEEPRRFTYRVIFIPETIGSILYLSRHAEKLKRDVIAGFVISCVGDERVYSLVPSRAGGTLADRVAEHVLSRQPGRFIRYTFLDRGSDERQYCSPGIDLPVCSVLRSKHSTYPEYHTSLDDLKLISPAGLEGSFEALRQCLQIIEANHRYRGTTLCEPQLGRRGLFPNVRTEANRRLPRTMMNSWVYADGTRDLIDLAGVIGEDALTCAAVLETLREAGVVEIVEESAGSET